MVTPRPHGRSATSPASRAGEVIAALKRAGVKNSRPRVAIIEVFYEEPGHCTAEELALRVRERVRGVSISTVYRTLQMLVAHGHATARQFGSGQQRFEPAASSHHDHLICTRCGAVVEFVNDTIEELQLAAARERGFEVETHRLEIYGVCPECRRGAASPPDELQAGAKLRARRAKG